MGGVVEADREDHAAGVSSGGRERAAVERMPRRRPAAPSSRTRASRSSPPAMSSSRYARRTVEQLLDDDRLVSVDERRVAGRPTRAGSHGRNASLQRYRPRAPGRLRAALGCAHDAALARRRLARRSRRPTSPRALAQPRHGGARADPAAGDRHPPPLPVTPRAGAPPRSGWSACSSSCWSASSATSSTPSGPARRSSACVLALVPLAGVLVAVRLIDRWEPEPRSLADLRRRVGRDRRGRYRARRRPRSCRSCSAPTDPPRATLFSPVVQAPIVEEFGKGLGVLLIFATARRAFDGPVDGVVYGALVGAGFAFTENIQYFAISFIEGGVADVTTTFFVRGILSPFAHVMFTSRHRLRAGARRAPRRARGPRARALAAGPDRRDRAARVLERLGAARRLLRALPHAPGAAVRRSSSSASSRCGARSRASRAAGWASTRRPGGSPRRRRTCSRRRAGRKARARVGARRCAATARRSCEDFIPDATALAAARQRAITGRDPQRAGGRARAAAAHRRRASGPVRPVAGVTPRGRSASSRLSARCRGDACVSTGR